MAKKKKSPEKVEEHESLDVTHVPDQSEVVEPAPESSIANQESDLAKHPKFAKFKSHGGN